jgi:phosphopantothenoylcysteine decarboxylase/phosphopantothenate--cysteine ligase
MEKTMPKFTAALDLSPKQRAPKNLILAVTGSIAAYKAYDIARQLVKDGFAVRVVLTAGALKFIVKETFAYLGVEKVYGPQDDFLEPGDLKNLSTVLHIALAKWCDRIIIAPLSANTTSQLAQGACSDLLTSLCLSAKDKDLIAYPAMNENMLSHPLTVKNLEILASLLNVHIVPPDTGLLACGDVGPGKLADPLVIAQFAPYLPTPRITGTGATSKERPRVLITTGATLTPLDPVRYLTNPSTGLTGLAIAKEYLTQGFQVEVIAGRYSSPELENLFCFPLFSLKRVGTTQEMLEAVLASIIETNIYISAAAIGDLIFPYSHKKLKKAQLTNQLSYQLAPDILKTVLEMRVQKKLSHLNVIGFAAETEATPAMFLKKWNDKPVDLLVGNAVHNGARADEDLKGFGKNSGHYYFISNNQVVDQQALSKGQLAEYLYQFTTNLTKEHRVS